MKKQNTLPRSSFHDAQARFSEIRRAVNEVATHVLTQECSFPVFVMPISDRAAGQADRWSYDGRRVEHRPGWSWVKELRRYRAKPRRIDAAFYVGTSGDGELWGLILGRTSNGRVVASLHYIERNPTSAMAAQFIDTALRYLELYAAAIGCKVCAVSDPHPGLVEYYKAKGMSREYTKGKKLVRLERDVSPKQDELELAAGLAHDSEWL